MTSETSQQPVRLGIIGAGFIAQVTHLHVARSMPQVALQAISDPRLRLLGEVAQDFNIPKIYSHHSNLLADPDIEAVIVCVHRRAMAPLVVEALGSGKAVLAEKPMAYTLEQAQRLVAAKAPRQPYAIGFMKRHDAGVETFRDELLQMLQTQQLGRITHVLLRDFCPTYGVPIPTHLATQEAASYRYDEGPHLPRNMPQDYASEYDASLNVMSHDLNLLRFLLPSKIEARCLRVQPRQVQMALLESKGFDIEILCGRSDSGGWDQSVEIFFERGRMQLSLPSPLARGEVARGVIVAPGFIKELSVPEQEKRWAFEVQLDHFIKAVRGGISLENGADACLEDMALIESLWRTCEWKN